MRYDNKQASAMDRTERFRGACSVLKQQGLTQNEIARAVGLSGGTVVSRLLGGQYGPPSLPVVLLAERVAKELEADAVG
jgi:transcriptional regulator with XRE-family HTH domain